MTKIAKKTVADTRIVAGVVLQKPIDKPGIILTTQLAEAELTLDQARRLAVQLNRMVMDQSREAKQ